MNNIQRLRELMEKAEKLPWKATENTYGGKEEAWCYWHSVGPLGLTGERLDDNDQLVLAAINLLPALLAVAEAAALSRTLKKRDPHGIDYENNAMLAAAMDKLDDALQKLNEVKL